MSADKRLGKWTEEESTKHAVRAYDALRAWDDQLSFYNYEHNPKLEAVMEKVARPIIEEFRALSEEHYKVRRNFEKHLENAVKPSKPVLDLSGYKLSERAWMGIVWHHSATKDGVTSNWPAIKRYHVEHNGWTDIGYNMGVEYVQDRDGLKPRLMMGRSLEHSGAHTYFVAGDQKISQYNKEYIGLCAVGNFDVVKPPSEIWEMCLSLTRALQMKYGISKDNVLGHRETYVEHGIEPLKTCPGALWSMNNFREAL